MERRSFLKSAATLPAVVAQGSEANAPRYKTVTSYKAWPAPGMPGPYPGQVAALHAARVIDAESEKVDPAVLRETMDRGMRALTGDKDTRDCWARLFTAQDVVGIKVNCSGAPGIMSTPEVVAEIVRNLQAVGVPAKNIWIYERFKNQMDTVRYERYVPAGVHVEAAEEARGTILRYDPNTYVEVDFFGEDDTRSNLVRWVSERFTKIVNVPNMKDHGASGVTGCLKNIAYGNFSNVARSHRDPKTHTLSFIATLAALEPLRSRTVLQVMDGLRGVWHGGPFSPDRQFRFYPKQMMFGTDPVAIDRLLIDVIEGKRAAERAISVWDRSPKILVEGTSGAPPRDPNRNRFFREPGHIEYATRFGLGVYDIKKIQVRKIEVA
jgi:uncharacterized protein (DUF362 family)